MQNHIVEMRKIARKLPQVSGVYLMRDRLGHVIYVGKAKNLRKRVSSYFQGSRRFIWSQPKIWSSFVPSNLEINVFIKQLAYISMSTSPSLFIRGFMKWTNAPQTLGISILEILNNQLTNS